MRKLYLIGFCILFFQWAQAQDVLTVKIDKSFGKLTFSQMTSLLKDKYGIKVYFDEIWIQHITTFQVDTPIVLSEFLYQTLTPNDLHYIIFQNKIVIMPGQKIIQQHYLHESNVIVIGNPLEKGKYNTANLYGQVLEGKTKLPIPGAQIICATISKAVSSDTNGKYMLELPTGKHRIKFTCVGLNDEIREINIHSDGSLDVELYEETISLNQIDVNAERPEDNFRSTSMGIEKLNIQSIKKLSVLMGETDLIKSMVMLPGVQSTGENATGFNVRGGNTDQNLILIANAPIFNTSHFLGLFSMLNANIVKDVTLYKSGIPARYGGRIASVMSIDLMKGEKEKIKVNGGIGIINSQLSVEGPLNKNITFIAGARSTYTNWALKAIKNYELKNSTANFYDFNAKIDYAVNAKNRLSLFGYGSNDDFYYYETAKYGYGNLIGAIKWNQMFNQHNNGTFNLNYSSYNANVVDFNVKNKESNLYTAIAQTQFGYHFANDALARQKINAGINGVFYTIKPGSSTPYSASSVAQTINLPNEYAWEYAAYFEDEFDLTPSLAVITGLRYSCFLLSGPGRMNNYIENAPFNETSFRDTRLYAKGELISTYQGLEPRISFRYEFQDAGSVKLGYHRNQQYIRQISNTATITPADFWKASDKYIQPLISDQYSVGIFKNFKKNEYETSIELYYKHIQNEVDYKNGAILILNANLEQDLILGTGKAYGAELMVKKSTGDLTGWLAYTYSRSFKKMNGQFDEEKINDGQWYRSNYDKPHDLTLFANYIISRRFTFSGNFTYSTGRPITYPEEKFIFGGYEAISYSLRNKYRLPDYHRLDLAITYEGGLKKKQFWRSSWTFSIYNIYGRKNTFSVFYEKQERSLSNKYNEYALYRFSIIGVPVPSFTYNFWF